jgi:hypothetical protein
VAMKKSEEIMVMAEEILNTATIMVMVEETREMAINIMIMTVNNISNSE